MQILILLANSAHKKIPIHTDPVLYTKHLGWGKDFQHTHIMYFLTYSAHFDRDKGVDAGRLCLRHLQQGTVGIWISATSHSTKQFPESFHQWGGVIPPEYRVPDLKNWQVLTKPIYMPQVKGVEGNFYKINPHNVVTDKGGKRGDFGIHRDANAPGSLGCIVMTGDRFKDFENALASLRKQGVDELPLFVSYS